VDEVRVWNRAPAQEEIAARMNYAGRQWTGSCDRPLRPDFGRFYLDQPHPFGHAPAI